MECPPSSATAAAPFDEYVAHLIARAAGPAAPAVRAVFERWVVGHSDGETFLDYLAGRGVLDRVSARGVLRAWQGGMDDRDARQLLDPAALGRAAARLAPLPDAPDLSSRSTLDLRPIGSRVGRYPVKGILGRGGFGPVYLSVHPTLRVPVALKPLTAATEPLRDRLRAEARRQAMVNHPSVVRVWDLEDGNDPALVLEYVPGENLRDRLAAEGPLDANAGFTLVAHAALGLRAAHRAGITHHDVKPANVLLTPDDGFKLADFGLARCRHAAARAVPAGEPRRAFGTLGYMAPEQFENCHDHRSDVYSLGLTAYHALTGVPPVPATDPDSAMLAHKRGGLAPVHHLVPGLRREVSGLIARMTAVDPDRRFDSYDELLRAAEAAFGMRLDIP